MRKNNRFLGVLSFFKRALIKNVKTTRLKFNRVVHEKLINFLRRQRLLLFL